MSDDPSFELQVAIVGLLKGDAPLTGLIDQRVYDRVPRSSDGQTVTATFPYVAFGEEQTIPVDVTCIMGSEIYITLHAWSRAVGFPEVKKICGRIRTVLHDAEIELPTTGLVSLAFDGRRIFRDPDGVTSHGVLTFLAIVEHD